MDFWPEFLASSWGKEFVAGGFGGIAGIVSGYPLDTLRIRQQSSTYNGSPSTILRHMVAREGPASLYRGMGAPLASVTFQMQIHSPLKVCRGNWITENLFILNFQFHLITMMLHVLIISQNFLSLNHPIFSITLNAIVFQTYAVLSRAFDKSVSAKDPPSYKGVALGGVGTGALQSILLSPVELVKIRLQLQNTNSLTAPQKGPVRVAKNIWKQEGLRGIYRGFGITLIRDAPSHGFYFWTYEYMREQLHPGCRKSGQESLATMLIAGGLAGVASWVCCYPFDVMKTRLQAQTPASLKYKGILDCLRKSIKQEGYGVLWRGLGTAVARAFVVNGAVFSAYEITLRLLFSNGSIQMQETI